MKADMEEWRCKDGRCGGIDMGNVNFVNYFERFN